MNNPYKLFRPKHSALLSALRQWIVLDVVVDRRWSESKNRQVVSTRTYEIKQKLGLVRGLSRDQGAPQAVQIASGLIAFYP
jgi:hypothetical protein